MSPGANEPSTGTKGQEERWSLYPLSYSDLASAFFASLTPYYTLKKKEEERWEMKEGKEGGRRKVGLSREGGQGTWGRGEGKEIFFLNEAGLEVGGSQR